MYTLIEIALSVGVLVSLVTVLSLCVCGCKNSNQKSELGGTAGVVKIRFDEEAPSPTPTTPASVKRASTQNSQRSLPEIPQPVGRHDSGDTASEIYATVNLDEGNKIVAEASTSRDHPYEHAYAKLQNESHNIVVEITPDPREDEIQIDERDASQSAAESVVISARVAISGQLPSSHELPYITPPSPRPEPQHYSGDSVDSAKGYTSISVREPLSNIRAHTVPAPAHYATVSDDSDEMYAAIEEAPAGSGSDTYAQIEPRRARAARDAARRSAPPEIGASTSQATHSRQASSSSCSNSTGALGSPKPEKRQANSPLPPPPPAHSAHAAHAAHTAHAAHAAHAAHTAHAAHAAHTAHAAHAAHTAHAAHAAHTAHTAHAAHPVHAAHPALDARSHQRISSTGDLFSGDKFRRSLNEKHTRNNSCVSSSDFYGCNYPVDKHRFSSADLLRKEPRETREARETRETREAREARETREPDPPPTNKNLFQSVDGDEPDAGSADTRVTESPSRNVEEMYAKVIKKAKTKTQEDPVRANPADEPAKPKYRTDDPGYETIDRRKSNHGYETIAHKERKISQNQDPGYETVKDFNKISNSNFANNNLVNKLNHVDSGPNSIISSDAGYERISKIDNSASDSEPNYEVLRGQPAYAAVRRRAWPGNGEPPEASYESMPHDPLYKGSGSESDPNYESVRPKDPNYESVNAQDPNYESLRLKDPKYESVRSKASKSDSMRSKKDPNYESVKYFELAKKEPPYEKVNHEATGPSVERSDSAAGYEKINVPGRAVPNGADVVSDYFQV